MTYGPSAPIVPPAREGHRRRFSEADKRRIVEEAGQPGVSLSAVARGSGMTRHGFCSAGSRNCRRGLRRYLSRFRAWPIAGSAARLWKRPARTTSLHHGPSAEPGVDLGLQRREAGGGPYRKSDPDVLVMQSAEMRLCEDPTDALNFARNRRVLVQRQMRAGLVVICHVR